MRLGAIALPLIIPALLFGPAAAAMETGPLMHVEVNLSDQSSLQRGARTFVNYCLSCHSAAYMRYNRMGKDLNIPENVLKTNFMFATDKPGDTMEIALTREAGEQFFGIAPPDLSVIARSRGADWLYTFFKTFYSDPARPFGVNNLAFKDLSMPHVLWELQGMQAPVYKTETNAGGGEKKTIESLEIITPGTQTAQEYDQTVKDLVNFLVYLGEPAKLKRTKIGIWVIAYLLIFLIIAYFLKKEYWRDIH